MLWRYPGRSVNKLACLLQQGPSLPQQKKPGVAPRHRRDQQGHYHCTRCAFSHTEWHRVMVHYQGHLAQGERSDRYQCKTYHKKLTSASSLSRHEKAHWERKWPCSKCLVGFSTKRDLNTHMQQVHKDQLGDLNCCYCGKTLRSVKPRSFAQYERYCSDNPDYQGPFKCRQGCGKEFTRRCEEVRHQKFCKGPQQLKKPKETELFTQKLKKMQTSTLFGL